MQPLSVVRRWIVVTPPVSCFIMFTRERHIMDARKMHIFEHCWFVCSWKTIWPLSYKYPASAKLPKVFKNCHYSVTNCICKKHELRRILLCRLKFVTLLKWDDINKWLFYCLKLDLNKSLTEALTLQSVPMKRKSLLVLNYIL